MPRAQVDVQALGHLPTIEEAEKIKLEPEEDAEQSLEVAQNEDVQAFFWFFIFFCFHWFSWLFVPESLAKGSSVWVFVQRCGDPR